MKKSKVPLDKLVILLKNPSHHLSVDVYNENVKVIKERGVNKHKPKYTLNQIGDALFEFIKSTNTRFDNLEHEVKNINTRLDYIVKANDLRDNK